MLEIKRLVQEDGLYVHSCHIDYAYIYVCLHLSDAYYGTWQAVAILCMYTGIAH